MAEERLQKILARAGIASRRAAERLMVQRRVTVNGKPATKLGMHADAERDHIKVDGKLLRILSEPSRYFLANKPPQMITSLQDPEGRPTVGDMIKAAGIKERIYPVGRLDWDADGLLLLTNDGDLAKAVMHPSSHLEKSYRVKVRGIPSETSLSKLRRGVVLDPGQRASRRSLPARIEVERRGDGICWLRVVISEGRQNQIKKMFTRVGHPVRRIRRTAIGPLKVGRLRMGEIRPMTTRDLNRLREALGLEEPPRATRRRSRRRPSDSA